MFSEVADLLGGFQNFILCLVIGLVIVTVITLAGFTLFGFEHPILGWYALFLNDKRKRTVALALCFLRMFYVGAMAGMAKSLSLTHCLVYLLFTVILWALAFRLDYVGYDLVYSAGLFGMFYLLYLMYGELNKVQVQTGIGVLTVLFSVLLVCAAIGQFFIAVNAVMPKEINKTEKDTKIRKESYVILLCLGVVLIVPYFVVTHTHSISLENGGIQLVDGETVRIEAGSKLTNTDNGCMISLKETSYLLAETPLYDKTNGRVIFTEYCSIVRPKLLTTNRISPMCILTQEDGSFFVQNGERVSTVENFFLFDGNDAYYFPDETILEWGEEQVVISNFSRVEVQYNQKIEIFDYETEQRMVFHEAEGFCIATLPGRERINLSTDILYRENGEEQMLFMQPMLLSDLE